ncbi:MAG: DNA polymerase I [Candidatus Yanofskybacteria bacterium RIFCSPHIGHO2_02_FULL_41_29]|uniref:DNA polymerase I n=1 Tax=Candidatus Yanofskybacteria bacterium RIFCSPHIGHO2_01_FULL_41_53 TaxID=1802663 RepID=A0A1F8EJD7_9BACT|nr:MAG: DNA polymerase I [Candidatus Yanofskybacteria bacterium RIFCSPHIGHO2_01_FULL_41_53]OGN12159.1 MAG: DNA polymerase I [Candidatus Yanofskybacteria bacterium RIFCSPHIGHO2_02_FULL_41_29]OGN17959.1 MAG: DNA polymerase I [Candidatus Yanofskybacteria bacterium RIFCSPHIGHO2_12_FULL_41_9]OGN23660.1 MAG: DNA polymerase I [Candidatus Yanofskybacteria bacterium RIFCSPLOWO2_01_FULL_41_67]OGN29218.1 MAG: DNA polymerase I [Candidatus Yanofskybacteria bacterium RIFCSPLOWO2_02_FULL_41_13]
MKKLVLIDSNALVHRAFHALPPTLTSPKGVLTNAVYGFTSVLIKMLKDLKPDYIAATYDLAGPTFRHKEFEEYKAHREKAPDELYAQIPLTKEVLKTFGIPIYEKQGFEADDLIGALAERGKKEKNLQVIIVTGDLDTLQLVDKDKVVVFTLRKGLTDTVTYNEGEVQKRYGLKPEQVVDFKGLKGDPSDNIPGVPGIGEKTAAMLIQKFGSMENLYDSIAEIKNQKSKIKNQGLSEKLIQKLQENKDQAFFSKKLATIVRTVDIDFSLEKTDWRKNLDLQAIEKTFKDFGFYSLVKRLSEIDVQSSISTLDLNLAPALLQESTHIKSCDSVKEIKNAVDKIKLKKEVVLELVGDRLVFTSDSKEFFSTKTELLSLLKEVFEDGNISKTGHDLKPVAKEFLKKGIHIKGLSFDTKIAAYLVKADRKDYDLPIMYQNELGKDLAVGGANRLDAVLELKKIFWDKLKNDGLIKIFEEIEMPLVPVLAETELNGLKIDISSLKKLSLSVNKELSGLEKKIHKHAGTQFNINSPKQLKEILFERLGLKGKVRKTAKGALSTAAGELDKLSGEHPIVDLILKYRELQKIKTTYIEPFPHLIDQKTGRLHTTLNQTGTVTGRLSSQDPNLQNIPIKTELGQEFRKAFISSPGYKLVSLDYSQLELRIAAHISGDKKMTEAFKRGEDIHTRTAVEIFGVTPEKVTANMRREAKAMNFGLLYGMGILGFQRASGTSREQAKEFINRYMAEFSGIARYMEDIKKKACKDGYVSTILGRRRYLPEINSGIPQLMAQAERMAINHPVQGTEGDFLRIAMNRISDLIHKEFNDNDVKMLLQVHDELLFEVKNNLVEKISKVIKSIMESVYRLDVPLIVDARYGNNWRDMEPI